MIFNQLAQGGQSGASNVVSGTFTTGDATGIESVSVPYEGGGYPVAVIVSTPDGPFGPDTESAEIASTTKLFAAFIRDTADSGSNACSFAVVRTSSATTYQANVNRDIFTSSNPSTTAQLNVTTDGTTLRYRVNASGSGGYGLIPSMEYRYMIFYSE
jgi:hypothetical protein